MWNWITVNPNGLKIAKHHAGAFKGAGVTVGLSPDDVPERIRGGYSQKGELVIEFEYLTPLNEAHQDVPGFGSSVSSLGVHSGRLYAIRVPMPIPQSMPEQITNSIYYLSKDQRFKKQQRQFEVVAEALTDNAQAILAY